MYLREKRSTPAKPRSTTIPASCQLDEPLGARNRGDAYNQQPDEDDEVECPVEDDRAERLSGGHPGVEPEPARAQEVADAAWEDVVHRDTAHRHLVEARESDLRSRRNPAPTARLEGVDDGERPDRERHEKCVRLAERVPHSIEVRVPDGEPEEAETNRHTHERDDSPEAP